MLIDNIKLGKEVSILSFHNNLSYARRCHYLTQEDLAELLNVSRQTVSQWENGIMYPRVEMLLKICLNLDIPIEYLFEEELGSKENTEK